MKKVLILVSSVMLYAQILPPFIGDRFQSFRYLSTANLLEDDFDYLLDPGRYFELKNNLLYTGLSNFATNSDALFSGIEGTHFMFGFKNTFKPMGNLTPLSLLYAHQSLKTPELNLLGGYGESESYISGRYDTDGNGIFDSLHVERITTSSFSEYKENPIFFGVSRNLGNMIAGIFVFHYKVSNSTEPSGDPLSPYGNFVYLREEKDIGTNILLEREEWNGTSRIDSVTQGNIFGGSIFIPSMFFGIDLGVQVGYGAGYLEMKENTSSTGFVDYNPGGALSRVDYHYKREYEIRPGGNSYFVRVFTDRKISDKFETYDNFYFTFFGNSYTKITSSFENLAETFQKEDIGTGILRENQIKDRAFGTVTYEENIKGFAVGYRYRSFIDQEKKIYFAIGLFFTNSVFNSTFIGDTTFETVNYFNDGDNQPDDPDDFTTTTTRRKISDLSVSRMTRIIELPAACEVKLTGSLFLRLGARPYFMFIEDEKTLNPLYSSSVVTRTVRGDGSETVTVDPVQTDTGRRDLVKEKRTGVFYSYGLSYKIGERFSMDLMNFSTLTDLSNWRVSVIFKF